MIKPHGGKLVCRLVTGGQAARLEIETHEFSTTLLSALEVSDLQMLTQGPLAPLKGL